MASEELLEMLKEAVRMELQVSIQYMWQHVKWVGVKGFAVKDELKKIAIEEMKHAERIAERLFYLGGDIPTDPKPIRVGNNLKEMIQYDVEDEKNTIEFYKKIIKKAEEEEDYTTAHIFKEILEDEEEHHDFFQSILEEL